MATAAKEPPDPGIIPPTNESRQDHNIDLDVTDEQFTEMNAAVYKMVADKNHNIAEIIAMVRFDKQLAKHIKGVNPTGRGKFVEICCPKNDAALKMILQGLWCPKHNEYHRVYPADMTNKTIITMFNVPLRADGQKLKNYVQGKGYEIIFAYHLLNHGYRVGIMKFLCVTNDNCTVLPEYIEAYRRKIGVRHKEQIIESVAPDLNVTNNETDQPPRKRRRRQRRGKRPNTQVVNTESLPAIQEETEPMDVTATGDNVMPGDDNIVAPDNQESAPTPSNTGNTDEPVVVRPRSRSDPSNRRMPPEPESDDSDTNENDNENDNDNQGFTIMWNKVAWSITKNEFENMIHKLRTSKIDIADAKSWVIAFYVNFEKTVALPGGFILIQQWYGAIFAHVLGKPNLDTTPERMSGLWDETYSILLREWKRCAKLGPQPRYAQLVEYRDQLTQLGFNK